MNSSVADELRLPELIVILTISARPLAARTSNEFSVSFATKQLKSLMLDALKRN
jgi:hypothetical protein